MIWIEMFNFLRFLQENKYEENVKFKIYRK